MSNVPFFIYDLDGRQGFGYAGRDGASTHGLPEGGGAGGLGLTLGLVSKGNGSITGVKIYRKILVTAYSIHTFSGLPPSLAPIKVFRSEGGLISGGNLAF